MGGCTETPSHSSDALQLTRQNFRDAVDGLPARARKVLAALLDLPRGLLKIITPEGKILQIAGKTEGPRAEVVLHNWRLPMRAFSGGTIGLAESFFDGDWDSPDVTSFLELFLVNTETGERVAGGSNRLLVYFHRLRHWLNANTRRGARRNITAHYDLGNTFYKAWLDPSMSYSSALFAEGAHDLESAQHAKYRSLAKAAGISESDEVLEIGCGWGAFAEFAAREIGCRITGLTISREQHDFAAQRIANAGLTERVTIKLQDYRDESGRYDRIASIEMFEAVGEKYWPVYFSKVRNCLKPGGTAGLQIITINEDAYTHYRKRPDFIQRYVFPGGMLPTPDILRSLGLTHGLQLVGERIFPQDYARTLAEWRSSFAAAWGRIAPLGFDERFRRLWEFYLHYCEAGFRSEYIDVRQVVFRG